MDNHCGGPIHLKIEALGANSFLYEYTSFCKGFFMKGRKQDVKEVVTPYKNGGKHAGILYTLKWRYLKKIKEFVFIIITLIPGTYLQFHYY